MDTTTQDLLAEQMQAQIGDFDDLGGPQQADDELYDLPLEIKIRTEVATLLCTGGPHIEAVAALDGTQITEARLDGHWGSTRESWPVDEGSGLWCALQAYAATLA